MSLLREAFERSDRRLAAIIEATEGGGSMSTAAIPVTAAGTDLDGMELRAQVEEYGHAQAAGEISTLIAIGVESIDLAAVETALLRISNGVALSWFWAGYEARDLQESES